MKNMSESELKKLMWKKLGGHMIDSGELEVADVNEVFQEIINEVAKEYPLPWYEWLRKQPEWQTYPETKIDLHDMWQRYAFEMIDWFKKYFGEQK